MDLVLASNRNYFFHLAIAAACAATARNRPPSLSVHILESDWTPLEKEAVAHLCEKFDCSVDYYHIDTSQFSGLPTLSHISLDTYSRVIAGNVVPVEKFIYIDCDVQVLRWPQYHLDFGTEGILAGVEQRNSQIGDDFRMRWQLSREGAYLNAGVLGVHAERWRRESCAKQVLKWLSKNVDNLPFSDQDALAYRFWDSSIRLSPHWNLEARHFFDRACGVALDHDVASALRDPAFIHYTGPEKPWNPICWLPYLERWWQMADMVASILDAEISAHMTRRGRVLEAITWLQRVSRFRLGAMRRAGSVAYRA